MRLVEEREDETSKKAYREIQSFIGTAKQEGPGLDIESGKGKSKITGNIKGDYFRKKRLRWQWQKCKNNRKWGEAVRKLNQGSKQLN